jgi:hypothetical protein
MRSPAERFSIGWPWVNGQVVDTIDYSLAKIFLEACENLGGGRTNANLMRHAFRSGSGLKLLLKGIPANPFRILENFLAFFDIKPV